MRVVKRDFYESEEIGNLTFWGRELLLAVWSYVDDNGVQKDSPVGIAGACFQFDLARDPVGTVQKIEKGIDELHEKGFVIRYQVDGIRFIEAAAFKFWQDPQKPAKPRYPKSSDPEALLTAHFRRLSGGSREGSRGISCAETEPEAEPEVASRGGR
ncbi:hypothetical protein A5680_06135 [Mycobacterium sp. E2989]|nr:hypothetical protein A5680_06135 [Mycobacterium sp. E2989]